MSYTVSELISQLQTALDQLNKIMLGGSAEFVVIDGVSKPTISKEVADLHAAIVADLESLMTFRANLGSSTAGNGAALVAYSGGTVKATLDALVAGQNAGVIGKATLADLNASLAYAEGTLGYVTNDPVTSNIGFYRKVGASGAGSWTAASYDRVAVIEEDLRGYPWRDAAAANLAAGTEQQLAGAIKAVVALGFTGSARAKQFRFMVVSKNHATYLDRIYISDENSVVWGFDGTVAGKADGPVWVTTATNGGYFKVLIDFRELPDGLLYNSASTRLLLSDSIYRDEALQSQIDAINTTLASGTATWRDPSSASLTATEDTIRQAILKVEAVGMPRTDVYRIVTFCKSDPTYGENIIIYNGASQVWQAGTTPVANKDSGPVWVKCVRGGDPGYFNLLVDYRRISATGVLLNSGASTKFKLSPNVFEDEKLREAIASATSSVPSQVTPLGRAIRVAVAGSSITWGAGWLGQSSYVGEVEDYLRTRLASTVHGDAFAKSGTYSTVSNSLFYKGSATLLSGAGSKATFSLDGDELSLCIARERGNVGAAVCELWVNGALYDTFSTANPKAVVQKSLTFSGDGSTVKFDLGEAFTYGHVLTVGGASKVVQMNTQGHGATFPAGVDALVIRKMVTVNGRPEVHHVLWFATAPAAGSNNISVSFDAGESITYVRGTVGQTTRPLSGTNESPYGDGNVAFDPANPSGLSSGLGFRETDHRSMRTWKFDTQATRAFEVRIASLDPSGTGTPQLYLNFATNRMHHIMNAGIGGWSAGALMTDTGLNGVDDLVRFQPDMVLLESCTNDDWSTHVDRAWRTRSGLTDAQVRGEETSNFFRTVSYVSANNYTVEDVRVVLTAVTETSADLSSENATFQVVPGDVIIFGDFKGDNRRVACRLVKSWDTVARRVTWGRPLRPEEMAHVADLQGLVGSTCMLKGAPQWVANVEAVIDAVRAALPNAHVIIGTSGIPNIRHRRLEGYRELAEDVCARKGAWFADFYAATLVWQYSQPPTQQLYLNASASTVSTGASEYVLYNQNGTKPDSLNDGNAWLYRGWSVKVNGVERINAGCHVVGGYKYGWPAGTTQMSKSNVAAVGDDYKLVFTSGVPAAGATIEVKRAANKWATDDCHPNEYGVKVFGQAATAAVRGLAALAASKPGAK